MHQLIPYRQLNYIIYRHMKNHNLNWDLVWPYTISGVPLTDLDNLTTFPPSFLFYGSYYYVFIAKYHFDFLTHFRSNVLYQISKLTSPPSCCNLFIMPLILNSSLVSMSKKWHQYDWSNLILLATTIKVKKHLPTKISWQVINLSLSFYLPTYCFTFNFET